MAHPPALNLADLIRLHKGNRTNRDLERDAGGSPGWKRWEAMQNAPLRNFPDPPTIESIARALPVTVETVVKACARSLGLPVEDTGSLLSVTIAAIPGTDSISDDEVRAIVALVRVAAARNQAAVEQQA